MGVVLGAAYESRADEASAYLVEAGAVEAAQELLDQAYDALPQRLAQLPRIGRELVPHNPEAAEVLAVWAVVRKLLGDDIELREYLLEDYLVLYAVHQDFIHLLTLQHHRQSGFNFSET